MVHYPDNQATGDVEPGTGEDDPGSLTAGEISTKEGTGKGKRTYRDIPEYRVVNLETEPL
jgi:hypothetical protein